MIVQTWEGDGYCPICEDKRTFRAESDKVIPDAFEPHWFRGKLRCLVCKSPPRERAAAHVLAKLRPDWRDLVIHESSPGGWALSQKLRRDCNKYVATQYDPKFPFGEMHTSGRWRNENLENQTFADEIFDIVIAQDVFEHLFNPGLAAQEIARTLRPGGLCLLTVPVIRPWAETVRRASISNGVVIHHMPEAYHGNPVGDGKSLVTIDWSIAIGPYLAAQSGMPFTNLLLDDMRIGVRDDANMLLIGIKQEMPAL